MGEIRRVVGIMGIVGIVVSLGFGFVAAFTAQTIIPPPGAGAWLVALCMVSDLGIRMAFPLVSFWISSKMVALAWES